MSKQKLKLTASQKQKFRRIRRLEQLKSMDPIEFEHYVGYLYLRDGYRVYTTVASGDEGVDLHLKKGLKSIVVQCKRYSGTVGQPTVRDLHGAVSHEKANAGALVTTGNISRPAENWAQGKPLTLIDGHALISWARGKRIKTQSPPTFNPLWLVGVLLVALLAWGGWQFLGQDTVVEPTDTPIDGDTVIDSTPVSTPDFSQPETLNSSAVAIPLRNFPATASLDELEKWQSLPVYTMPYQDGERRTNLTTWQIATTSDGLLWLATIIPSGDGRMEPDMKAWIQTAVNTYQLNLNTGQLTTVAGDSATAVVRTNSQPVATGLLTEFALKLDDPQAVAISLTIGNALYTSNPEFSPNQPTLELNPLR